MAPAPELYKFHVEKPGDGATLLTFATAQPMAEQGETAMNERLLKEMAKARISRSVKSLNCFAII